MEHGTTLAPTTPEATSCRATTGATASGLRGITLSGGIDAEMLTGPGPRARNTFAEPEVVVARPFQGATVSPSSRTADTDGSRSR